MDQSIQSIIDALRTAELAQWDQMPDIELYMDQVITYLKRELSLFTDQNAGLITPSIINNYVKAGLVPRPEKKKYGREQLSALTMACLLKSVMPMNRIKTLVMRDDNTPDQQYYEDFAKNMHNVLNEEANLLDEMMRGGAADRDQVFALALCFAMRSNADRYIADRLLTLLYPPEEKQPKESRRAAKAKTEPKKDS
ncbi:DUF1836 domain-containing protein [Eubacteriales bacterium OttesenSCG-928-N13]|nr:DUF1836 domain-containing protein [Eubacteriales bacterium OttesenSCG-928-N13]